MIEAHAVEAPDLFQLGARAARAVTAGDGATARRLLDRALVEAPEFAMAAYWRAVLTEPERQQAASEHALARSRRATDRERLTITAAWAHATDHPSLLAVAETLAVRFPTEPAATAGSRSPASARGTSRARSRRSDGSSPWTRSR
ncbi:MAG TPA: hypothetical protein VNK43_01500 [Gemmatimonadales bacterium]|nr:hypothetical protein [Gemmatimonadales bacterium]